MIVIEKATIYQCEYCKRKYISKNGANKHEEKYCKKSPIVKIKRKEEVLKCEHDWETVWSYIPGECVKEPDYDYCKTCGVTDMELDELNQEETN